MPAYNGRPFFDDDVVQNQNLKYKYQYYKYNFQNKQDSNNNTDLNKQLLVFN